MSEKSNIERDDLAAGNRLAKVRFDMSADIWGQTEERGFAESRAEYDGEVLSIRKTGNQVYELTGSLESVDADATLPQGVTPLCDDPPHAADDDRCGMNNINKHMKHPGAEILFPQGRGRNISARGKPFTRR